MKYLLLLLLVTFSTPCFADELTGLEGVLSTENSVYMVYSPNEIKQSLWSVRKALEGGVTYGELAGRVKADKKIKLSAKDKFKSLKNITKKDKDIILKDIRNLLKSMEMVR